MPFLRNSWYVAGWSDEVPPGGHLRRKVLGEDLLVLRDEASVVSVLRNRCPHRFAPLHLGQRLGNVIECPYHGLRFDMSGRCVLNPHGNGTTPTGAFVQTFPVQERHMLIWVWMGNAASAEPSNIPDLIGLEPDVYAINKGYMYVEASYQLLTDNIMDLGHIEFLHRGLLGSEAIRSAEIEVSQDGSAVISKRLTRNETLPPALEALYETSGSPVDRWLDVKWYPAGNMQLVAGVAPAGAPARVGREAPGVHLMTPETSDTTHYFWSNARNFRRDDTVLHETLEEGLVYAFDKQDKPMILAQQNAMGREDFWDLKPAILPGDAGAIRARRILQKLIRKEREMMLA
jgi:phenylpropionate dioxygenase-like ring-hydroxylating dioxygenase large terminal subunit